MIEMFVERAFFGAVKGEHWRVSWFDRALNQFVGGSGGSPWKALAWACVDREETRLGLTPIMARNRKDKPRDVLARLPATKKQTYQAIAPIPTATKTRERRTQKRKTPNK